MSDPAVRQEATAHLTGMFAQLGQQAGSGGGGGPLGLITGEFEKVLEIPMDLAKIFIDMGEQLAVLVIKSLEEAGMEIVKLVPGVGG